ncbi:4151_t:CDS:1, partial [Acaulospora morrowiae]
MESIQEQIRREVKAYRNSAQPFSINDFCFDERNNRAYFLATDPSWMKTSTLYYVDLDKIEGNDNSQVVKNGSTDVQRSDLPFSFANDEIHAK